MTKSNLTDPNERSSALEAAFNNETIWESDEETLRDHLKTLNQNAIMNEFVRHRAITRALTINHIQMARVIQSIETTMTKLNAGNDVTQRLVVRLTVLAIFVGLSQIVAAILPLLTS